MQFIDIEVTREVAEKVMKKHNITDVNLITVEMILEELQTTLGN
jgi:hypothetical protein